MKLVYKKSKNSDVKQYFWEIEVAIDPMEKKINYLYLVYDKESLEISYERNKERIVVLDSFSVIFCNRKNNTFKIYDSPLQTKFNFSEINENIILGIYFFNLNFSTIINNTGPCPLNYEEIDLLYKKGVKGILNLQRDEDMVRFGVDWDYMKEIYWSKDMHPVNYKIKDKLPDQIGQKILIAAEILNGMIEKFGVKIHPFLFNLKKNF